MTLSFRKEALGEGSTPRSGRVPERLGVLYRDSTVKPRAPKGKTLSGATI